MKKLTPKNKDFKSGFKQSLEKLINDLDISLEGHFDSSSQSEPQRQDNRSSQRYIKIEKLNQNDDFHDSDSKGYSINSATLSEASEQ